LRSMKGSMSVVGWGYKVSIVLGIWAVCKRCGHCARDGQCCDKGVVLAGQPRLLDRNSASSKRMEELDRAEMPSKVMKALNKLAGLTTTEKGQPGKFLTRFLPLPGLTTLDLRP